MNYEIKTARLTLKPPTIYDANILFHLMSDERLTKFLTWDPHQSIDTTKVLIQNLIDSHQKDKGYHWCVWLNDSIIGIVSLIDVRRKIRTWTINRAELSYWIGTAYQGKGFATEASEAIIAFGFKDLYFHKIIVAHAAENMESKSICLKLHFIEYGKEHDAFLKNNQWHDLIWYELINPSHDNK